MPPMLDLFETIDNPLNSVEEIFLDNEWVYSREHNDKICVHISTEQGSYSLDFLWQSEFNALLFSCRYDLIIPEHQQTQLNATLRSINTKLWLGHFDVINDLATPCFRHTTLLGNISAENIDSYIRDLIEIGVAECEKHYFAFNMLANNQPLCNQTLHLALSQQAGEA